MAHIVPIAVSNEVVAHFGGTHFGKAVCMCTNYRHVARLRARVVFGGILLDSKMEDIFLGVCCRQWIFSYVCARQGMLCNGK